MVKQSELLGLDKGVWTMNTEKETQFLTEEERLELEQVKREREDRRQARREDYKSVLKRAISAETTLVNAMNKAPFLVSRSSLENMAAGLSAFIRHKRFVGDEHIRNLKWTIETLNEVQLLASQLESFKTPGAVRPRGASIESIADKLEAIAFRVHEDLAPNVALLKSMPTNKPGTMVVNMIGFGLVPGVLLSAIAPASFVFGVGLVGSLIGFFVALPGSIRSSGRSLDPVILNTGLTVTDSGNYEDSYGYYNAGENMGFVDTKNRFFQAGDIKTIE